MKINAAVIKKVSHPHHEFGSIGVSLSVEIECPVGKDPMHLAQELFHQLDEAVEIELHRQAAAVQSPMVPMDQNRPGPNQPPSSTPVPHRTARSRGPAPVTASQMRLLERLLDGQPDQRGALLSRCQVAALDQLTCRQASEAIDQLKGVTQ